MIARGRAQSMPRAIRAGPATLIAVEMNEPIDTATVTPSTFYVRDQVTNQNVPGTISVDEDRRTLRF
ncbi:MAG: hypothetical protein ACO3S6_01695, partial [Aquiluna sp.]